MLLLKMVLFICEPRFSLQDTLTVVLVKVVCLSQGAVKYMDVEDWRTKMIGLAVKFFPDNSYLCIASSVS